MDGLGFSRRSSSDL